MLRAYPEIRIESEVSKEPSACILADVGNVEHLGEPLRDIATRSRPLIIIDHHIPQDSGSPKADIALVDEHASSTSEIVCSLYESTGRKPSKAVATILLVGIVYDSKRFSIIGRSAFHAAAFLIDSGADYQSAISVLRHQIGRSERIARLKAAQRSRIIEMKGWIIGVSKVSSFGASACRSIIDLGADAAIVSSDRKTQKRVSARSTSTFHADAGVSLAKIMQKVGTELGGIGGGHPTAATVSGIHDVTEAEKLILHYIEETVKEKIM
jgi:nanoRNase/pAp phosphatase (c-di-AMP/oligoRNAs hydrolase)